MKQEEPYLIVAVYLRGGQLQPMHVSEVLGIKPSRFQVKGGLKFGSKDVIAKIGVWALIAQTNSPILADHLDELFGKIGDPIPLDKIEGVEEAYLDIFMAPDAENQTVESKISKSDLQKINRLGLDIQLTITPVTSET
jgi:hypothetical protein